MRYDDVVAAFFTASPDPAASPEPVRTGAPARRLRDAIEPLAMHSVWSRRTNEALAACGLDFFASYVGGRAAALGEPSPPVVAATFAVFEPAMITATYEAARAACPRDRLVAEREQATIASLHDVLDDQGRAADVEHVVEVLRRGLAAATPLGRPLFAGLAGEPWPADPVGRLWRCCELLREHRGDGHVAVLAAEGLDAVEANIATELWLGMELGSYSATRGWAPEQLQAAVQRLERRGLMVEGQLTIEGLDLRVRIEQATDRAERAILTAIGADLDPVVELLADWSAACVTAGAFPPDPFKRAAG
jgi:hypothetical protein